MDWANIYLKIILKTEKELSANHNSLVNFKPIMIKRTNKYQLILKEISLAKEEDVKNEALEFEFDNHDNLFEIIKTIKSKNIFEDEQQSAEFAIGLKMFSEVMIKNRDNALFTELFPVFGSFMRKLKSHQ